jgi:hypothetical protein
MKTTKHQRQTAFARYKASPTRTPEAMADLAVAVGAASATELDTWRDRFAADFSGTRAAMWTAHTAAVAATPATPAHAGSGASVAAGSAALATAYPSAWSRAVSAAQRVTGRRQERTARTTWPTVAPGVRANAQPTSGSGYYDKSVKPSAQAAAQEDARQADLRRMAAEQAARFSA